MRPTTDSDMEVATQVWNLGQNHIPYISIIGHARYPDDEIHS